MTATLQKAVSTPARAQRAVSLERIVTFTLDGERYGLPIEEVQEIQQIVEFHEIARGGDGVLGTINLRGEVLPVLDLAQWLGLAPIARDLETPMIIVSTPSVRAALVVEAVDDVVGVQDSQVQSSPQLHPLSAVMHGVACVDDELVHLVDATRMLAGLREGL